MATEAEKSHDLLSESWRLRKAGCIIQSKSEVLGTRGTNDVTPTPRLKL